MTVWFPFRSTRRGNGNAVSIRRRFWQSGWASGWKCRCARKFLYRIRNTEPLKELNPDERLRNLQQAFQADAEAIRASGVQNVLLVDDIYTTGSTAEACSPGASVVRELKSLVFCRLYWTRTLKWDMIEKIGRGKPYKWKYSGISG